MSSRSRGSQRTELVKRPQPLLVVSLWILLFLFILRVIGQLLVFQGWGFFLPPMREWSSGLLPYSVLLPAQIFIILLYSKICVDFTRGRGFFVIPQRRLGSRLLLFGSVYLAAMLTRYILRMSLYPTERWTGGSIPIFLHWVLATFLLLVGGYHRKRTRDESLPKPGQ